MSSDDVVKEIRGTKVAFQDCFIDNRKFILTYPPKSITPGPADLPLTVPAGKPMLSAAGICIYTYSLLITEDETFLTLDAFLTWTRIGVPPGILTDAERHSITGVAAFSGTLIFIINGSLFLKTSKVFKKLGMEDGAPETGVLGISRRKWCKLRYLFKVSER